MLPSLLVIVYKSVVDNPIVMAAENASAPDSGSNWLHRLFVGSAGKGLASTFDCFDPTPALGAAEEGVVHFLNL